MQFGIFDFLTLFGSLGLFLYGMKTMSDALMEVAGDRLRSILGKMTANPALAVFTGFLITSVVQSSSATTLMVVSFANATLLTLTEAIGVIMGAYIGTTVTAWLITILGFKVSMSAIALPLVGVGFLLIFSEKKQQKKWGQFIVGFAILFIGLQFLKDSVPDIGSNPEALAFLARYTQLGLPSILLFLAIGTLLTVVIQSSSATMALTLVMCNEGWIPFDMAAAMVLGENIGTTITANLAAIVANYNAKRTARAHLIFNIIGVIWVLILFIPFLNLVDWMVTRTGESSPFLLATSIPIALSLFHTTFNVANTVALVAFIPLIAKVVVRIVPEVIDVERAIDEPKFLTDENLRYPQTGISALIKESLRLFEKSVFKAIAHGVNVHRSDIESDKKLKKIVEQTDVFEIDFDALYYRKIKTIYSLLIEFATKLQSRFDLDKDKIELIRNIQIANRDLVSAVKAMKSLHINMSKYVRSENQYIRKEYNALRRMLLQVIRQILNIRSDNNPEKSLKKLQKVWAKAKRSDVILDGSIDKLVRKQLITNEMATSLMNDNDLVNRMIFGLINFGELIYLQRDLLIYDEVIQAEAEGLLQTESTLVS